ncbi:MAG TPA: hypothetical protein VMG08_06850 [Allosphingosinicella sp.]|nr:hypothetical protein [Allosphingosinicella sp.]
MRFRLLIAVLTACLTGEAMAQDRLMPVRQPDDPLLAAYRADISRAFAEAFEPDVALRAVLLPSFQVEQVVGIRRRGDGYEIFALRPSLQLWTYQSLARLRSGRGGVMTLEGELGDPDAELRDGTQDEIRRLEAGLPEDPRDVPLTRCAVPLEAAIVSRLRAVWRGMLDEVRPGERLDGGADGTSYEFSMEAAGLALRGETWSPRRGTRLARLVGLAEAMRDYCDTRRPERLRALTRLVGQFGARR